MAKFPSTAAPATEQDAAWRPDVESLVNVPFQQARAPAVGVALGVFLIGMVALMLRDAYMLLEAWGLLLVVSLLVGLAVFLKLWFVRVAVLDDAIIKRRGVPSADVDGDGWGAHPVQVRQNQGSKPSEAVIVDRERAAFLAFIRTAETANTVRALAAAGWRDDRLNSTYRQWLNDLVMPDGTRAAENWGKGQWRLRFPAVQIAEVVDRLDWQVNPSGIGRDAVMRQR